LTNLFRHRRCFFDTAIPFMATALMFDAHIQQGGDSKYE